MSALPEQGSRRTYEDTKVSPSGIVGDVEIPVETVSNRVLTELTVAVGIGVVDVSTNCLGKGSSVFTTCLTSGRGYLLAIVMCKRDWELTENIELLLLTDDWDIVQGGRNQTSDEPCEGVEPVHPTSPEVG
jgi:hypothetical protein